MAKWSVALFGHHKPRFELREKELSKIKQIVAHGYHRDPYYYLASSFSEVGKGYAGTGYHKMTLDINLAANTEINKTISRHVEMPVGFDTEKYFIYNVTGWEKRAEPTDIIAFKGYRMQKGIVGYSKFHTYGKDVWTEKERKEFLIITLDNLDNKQIEGICESVWDLDSYKIPPEFPEEPEELYPTEHLKKRRFHIPMNDLKVLGVDEGRMLDKQLEYVPDIRDIQKIESFDKMNSRYVLESDGLNLIRPIIYGGKV